MKRVLIATLTAAAAFSVGCSDPFKRSNNPTEEYQNVIDKARPYEYGQIDPEVKDADNTQKVCLGAFDISVIGDRAANLMVFSEQASTSYTIQIRSYLGDDFEITTNDKPAEASFKQIDAPKGQVDKNVKYYQFSWAPAKGAEMFNTLSLHYTSSYYRDNCATTDVRHRLTLAVLTSTEGVTVNAVLPPSKIAFGETFQFDIEVQDPASTATTIPKLLVDFKKSMNNSEVDADKQILNAAAAVSCDKNAALKANSQTVWVFKCSFDSNKVEKAQAQANTGKIFEAAFAMTATSGRDGAKGAVKSPVTAAFVELEFPVTKTEAPVQGAQ